MAQRSKKKAGSKRGAKKAGISAARRGSNAGIKITSRLVDVRRHTRGYMAGTRKYTVSQIRKIAQGGGVRGVQVVGNHIQALPGQPRLTDLPMKVVK